MPSKIHPAAPNQGFQGSSFVYTPLEHVRVLFISFLQGLFAHAPPGSFRWTQDESTSELFIRDENPLKVQTTNARPAITLTMGGVQFYSLGMDDMLYQDLQTGQKTKGVLIPGSISLNCISRVDQEAHNLAWIVSEHIWLLRELFLKMGFFELGRGVQITPPSAAGSLVQNDGGEEWYCSTAVVPFQFQRKSAFTPLGLEIVQGIEQKVRARAAEVAQMGGQAETHQPPVLVEREMPPTFVPNATDAAGRTPDPAGERLDYAPTLQPHPLNPAAQVTVRTAKPNSPAIRPPRMPGWRFP